MPQRGELRIVSVNDVYALDNLPRLKTLAAEQRASAPGAFLFVLAGDFLAPSLLSSIDAGRAMVDCLNLLGLTHVVLGNHEDDLPVDQLRARLAELAPKCLGTNVLAEIGPGLTLPPDDVVEVDGMRVGIVGVVMADPSVYKDAPFGGVALAPANDAAIAGAARLRAAGCAAVVAITHQSIASDRRLAEADPPFLAIIGGHEHTPMLVHAAGTWIVKAGAEAVQAAITEVVWPADGGPPAVTVRLEDTAGHAPDPELAARVERHLGRVRELTTATLLQLAPGESLSSVGSRHRQTSIGTLLCSRLRDALGAEACVFNGGGIRASREYARWFTYGDIEAEVPFDNEVVVVRMDGSTLRDAIAASRARAPDEFGGFLQVDDGIVLEGDVVVAVAGAPLAPDRAYAVAIVRELLLGLDRVEPLVRWAEAHPAAIPPAGSGREPKLVLVQALSAAIWRRLGGFAALDVDRDGRVTAEDVAAAVRRAYPSLPPSRVLTELVMRAVDANEDRTISSEEAVAVAPGNDPVD